MKNIKKLALLMVTVMTIGLIAGCGLSFDAEGYVKALLDNSYKNDSTAFVEMKIGTEEEAAELYEKGLDAEVSAMVTSSGVNISDEMQEEYRALFAEILAGAKYTVDSSEKQDDGTYVVTITYEKMNVFGPAMEAYIDDITAMAEDPAMAELSDDELYDVILGALRDCLKVSLENVTYEAAETTTIRVERTDNVYAPNEEDIANLERAFFDIEAMEEAE